MTKLRWSLSQCVHFQRQMLPKCACLHHQKSHGLAARLPASPHSSSIAQSVGQQWPWAIDFAACAATSCLCRGCSRETRVQFSYKGRTPRKSTPTARSLNGRRRATQTPTTQLANSRKHITFVTCRDQRATPHRGQTDVRKARHVQDTHWIVPPNKQSGALSKLRLRRKHHLSLDFPLHHLRHPDAIHRTRQLGSRRLCLSGPLPRLPREPFFRVQRRRVSTWISMRKLKHFVWLLAAILEASSGRANLIALRALSSVPRALLSALRCRVSNRPHTTYAATNTYT